MSESEWLFWKGKMCECFERMMIDCERRWNECWKWWNGRMEKYECWNSNVIENEKNVCVEMLKDVKSVKCRRKIMEK